MANNERTQVKATIRRAMQAAERATNELDASAMKELEALYKSALTEIETLVTHSADELGRVRLSQLQKLTRQIEEILGQLNQTQSKMVEGYIVESARNGGNIFSTTVAVEKVSNAIDSAVLSVRTMKMKDGLQLSDRLWRVHRNAKETLINAVEQAVILGNSAADAAREYQRKMQPVPEYIARQADRAISSGINKRLGDALMREEGAPYHQIKRVMRTEINRAHGTAFQNSAFEDEFVIGTKFKLSPNHPKRDVCDMHASANLYGLGNGVYPRGKSPWPAHPNTLSYEQVVFVDEVSDEDRAGQTSRIDWLNKQSSALQKAVLGHDKKVSALQQGHLNQGMITTPWKHLEPALKRKGIDTDAL